MKRILYIGNKLSQHGYTPTSIETLGAFFELEGYSLFYSSEKKNQIMRFLDMVFSVFKYRKQVDFVIIDTYSTISFWYVLMVSQLCRFFQLKYIPILHGGNLPKRLDATPRLCKMVFNHSYKNVAPSGYLLDAFSKRGYTNLVYIPNSIDLTHYPYLKDREVIFPKMLWVRSFASLYNPKMAVDVLKAVQKEYPFATLCMVGPDKDGSLALTKSYAQMQNVNIIFTGRLSKEEWVSLSKNYNVFINTTNFDNTPVSVIEAMSLGLPVVTTNVGGIPFLLESRKTALLVDAGSTAAMASFVQELIENLTVREYLTTHARTYVEGFDWKQVRLLWKQVLSSVK